MSKLIVAVHYRDTGDFFQNGEVVSEMEDKVKVRLDSGHGVVVFRKDTLISLSGLLYIDSLFFVE